MSNDPDYLAWRERKLAEVHLRGMATITLESPISDADRARLDRAWALLAHSGVAVPTAQPE